MVAFQNQYNVIGLMSGTSLDGLDVCYVHFENSNGDWVYKILDAETIAYPADIIDHLTSAQCKSAFDFILFHKQYGRYIGKVVKRFVDKYNCKPDFIASHGHTIFHQPEKGITFQIGDGADIAAVTNMPVVCNFRNLDVALGGQGAPLVPIGDALLFKNYDCCLNIGGFANISFQQNNKRVAYDICPANFVLNHYTQLLGKKYDEGGQIAASGKIHNELLAQLNNLSFYKKQSPKSLGREWVETEFLPIVESYKLPIADILATLCEHAAIQIASSFTSGRMLVTGGGAYNKHLILRIKTYAKGEIVIPDNNTVDFKEALVFAFLGVLYCDKQVNCLQSVTGAAYDNIGGVMYNPSKTK